MLHLLCRFVVFLTHIPLFLTRPVTRRSHWHNLGRGSERLRNTGLCKPFSGIFLFLPPFYCHFVYYNSVTEYSRKLKFSDKDKFLFNPDAVIHRFCLPKSAQIMMSFNTLENTMAARDVE